MPAFRAIREHSHDPNRQRLTDSPVDCGARSLLPAALLAHAWRNWRSALIPLRSLPRTGFSSITNQPSDPPLKSHTAPHNRRLACAYLKRSPMCETRSARPNPLWGASDPWGIRTPPDRAPHLLSGGANTSRLGEGRPDDTTRSAADEGHVVAFPEVGGLHHRDERRAA